MNLGNPFSKKIDERNEWVYYATQLAHSLIFTIPIWIVYYQGRITPAQISILVTLQFISQMVMELPSGALADMIGRKRTNLLGFLIGSISYLFFPLANSFSQFLLFALLVGISDSFRTGSEEALIYDTYKQVKKEKAFSRVYANGNIVYQMGLIVSTALGGMIYEFNQYFPYIFYGLALLIGSLIATRYIEPHVDSETFTVKNYLRQISIGSREAFKNTYTKYLSLFYIFVGGISWSGTLYFNQYMMLDLVPNDGLRGILTAAMRLLNVVVIASVLKNEKLFNWRRTVLFFPVIMIFGFMPGVWLEGMFGLPFVQAAMIATTARWIILSPITNDAFSSKYRATAISLLSLLIGVVYIGLTMISALVIPALGIKVMYSFIGLVALITVVPLGLKLLKLKQEKVLVETA